MTDREIRYCATADGISIAYTTAGEGRPLVAMPVPAFSHMELNWQMFAPILPPLAARFRYVSYDARGSGMSDRSAVDFSMEAMLRDLEAVGAQRVGEVRPGLVDQRRAHRV